MPETLRLAMVSNPKTLNPILSTQTMEAMAEAFVFDPLVATDPEGHDYPVLASVVPTIENGGISKDGLTITYHLRHNVRWHDNVPFTSRDVRFSISAIMNPNYGRLFASRIRRYRKRRDSGRLHRHHSSQASRSLRQSIRSSQTATRRIMVLPAHLLEHYSSLDRVAFNSHPNRDGPFRFVQWLRGDRIEYVANDDYFLGKPKLRRIILHIVPDENTIANELRSHEIDWFIQATPRTYPQIKGSSRNRHSARRFNGNDNIQINVTKPPLDDARVRQAVGLAIDKRVLVDKVTFGTTVPAKEDLPHVHVGL